MPCTFNDKGICKEHDSNAGVCHKYLADVMSEMWEAKKAYNKVVLEKNKLEDKLQSLLALIHRDGGHYTAEHGLEKSYLDASEVRGRQINALDVLEKALSKIREYTTMHQTWCNRIPRCSCGLLNATSAAHDALQAAKACEKPIEGYRPVIFNEYQARNLLLLLNLIGYPHTDRVEPFGIMNNGDWVGEIALKLAHLFFENRLIAPQANTTRDRVIQDVQHWLAHAKPEDIGKKPGL